MSRADSIALPTWALNIEGHALVEQVIAERPEPFIRRGQYIEGGGVKVYLGKPAGLLRQMHSAWLDYEQSLLDRQYHDSGFYDQAASDALFRVEDATGLIERVLIESDEQALRAKIDNELAFTIAQQRHAA